MADQEKQQLLEALEEKQRSREEKAQQQEKMLQQLKAGIPGVLTWGLGFFRTLLTFHVSIPPGTIKGNGGEDAGWKPGYGESHAVTLQHAQACGGIRQKPRAHMHLPWPDKARSRPPESRRGSGREEAIGAAHAASFGFILRRMMPHFSPCTSRLSSAETMQHEIAELSAVLGHGALWGLSIRRAQEGSAGWGVGWYLKSDGSIIWQRWRVAVGCGW